jgi:hypothetical protein
MTQCGFQKRMGFDWAMCHVFLVDTRVLQTLWPLYSNNLIHKTECKNWWTTYFLLKSAFHTRFDVVLCHVIIVAEKINFQSFVGTLFYATNLSMSFRFSIRGIITVRFVELTALCGHIWWIFLDLRPKQVTKAQRRRNLLRLLKNKSSKNDACRCCNMFSAFQFLSLLHLVTFPLIQFRDYKIGLIPVVIKFFCLVTDWCWMFFQSVSIRRANRRFGINQIGCVLSQSWLAN